MYQSKLEHPLHPQCLHMTSFPVYKSALGTRQIQVVLKLVYLELMHWRQHNFSYPGFFHFAIKAASAYFYLTSH